MQMSKTIIFFGNERLATGISTDLPIIKALVLNGYNIAAIVVTPSLINPSRKQKISEIADFANTNNLPLIEYTNQESIIDILTSHKPSIGILASFGKIIPQEVIDLFPFGIINIHPSLLPKHRGPIPIEAPILMGERQTGVTIMQLVKEMDAGPIYDQQIVSLNGNETKQDLANRLDQLGAERLIYCLPNILNGTLKPIPQSSNATYDKKITKKMSLLNFNKSADILEREVRAFIGWPRSITTINSKPLTITQSHVVKYANSTPSTPIVLDGQLAIETTDGALIIDRLIPAGSKEMDSKEYLKGHSIS